MKAFSNNWEFISLAVLAATFAVLRLLPAAVAYLGIFAVVALTLLWVVKAHWGKDFSKKGIASLKGTISGVLIGIVLADIVIPVMAAESSVGAVVAQNSDKDIIFTLINAAIVMIFSLCVLTSVPKAKKEVRPKLRKLYRSRLFIYDLAVMVSAVALAIGLFAPAGESIAIGLWVITVFLFVISLVFTAEIVIEKDKEEK